MHKLTIYKSENDVPSHPVISIVCQHGTDMTVFTGSTVDELMTFLQVHGAHG